jgi:hippurate hydrolase
MKQHLRDACHIVENETGVTIDCEIRESYPGVVNHDAETALAEAAAQKLLGAENVCRIDSPTMTTEDFGYFLLEKPGTYYHIGAGCSVPLHNAAFLPTADCAVTAAALHAAVLHSYLLTRPAR